MFLKYYLDESGNRVYTLKKTDPQQKNTFSAHPARFSPEDKYSKYRIIIKKRFNLLPTQQPPVEWFNKFLNIFNFLIMLYFEWRRIFRQKLRDFQIKRIQAQDKGSRMVSYKQYNRIKLMTVCVTFFIGWKILGLKLVQDYFYVVDESTNERRLHTLDEIRQKVFDKRISVNHLRQITKTKKPDRPPIELTKTTFDLDF